MKYLACIVFLCCYSAIFSDYNVIIIIISIKYSWKSKRKSINHSKSTFICRLLKQHIIIGSKQVFPIP